MSLSAWKGPKTRRRITSLALVLFLVAVAVLFRHPLIGWFTGKSMGGDEGAATAVQTGAYAITAKLDPDPPQQRGNALVLEVKDATGAAVDDATVEVYFDMPAMGAMSEMKGGANVAHEKGGRYRATFDLPMAGSWTLKSSVEGPKGKATQDFTFTVGSKGLAAGRSSGGASAMTTGSMSDAGGSTGAIDHYTCSMHPSVRQSAPGKCPICGMDLVAVTKEQQEQGVVMIDAVRRQLIGVRTAPVTSGPMRTSFHALGRVSYDEAALTDVSLKVRGWITKLSVNETGQRVVRGQTMFTLYSPELYNAEQDFLLATRVSNGTRVSDAGPRVEGLGGAARQRLRLLGVSEAQIDAIAKNGAPLESLPFASPASGFVIEKNVVEGASVEPGMRLYRLAALGKIWVEADVYEADLASVSVGQPAQVDLDYRPGQSYEGRVGYVYPTIDPKTRTGRLRIVLANRDLDLRPGMYANVSLSKDLGTRVQVPAVAVVYTGPRRIVFVDLGDGRFRPQEVQLGVEADGMYEVLSGLEPGNVVATSGVFLIAAEARITTAAKYWEKTSEADSRTGTEPPAMHTHDALAVPISRAATPSPPARSGPQTAPAPSATAAGFTCPMHPEVQSATPGKCPSCGMDLVPKVSP
jgi:multidrug efflux pump subunit AcrA (membrane-fusion protein)